MMVTNPTTCPLPEAELIVPTGWLWKAADGTVSVAKVDIALPPGGRIILPAWFVMRLLARKDGRLEVQVLSPILSSAALAERSRDDHNRTRGADAMVQQINLSYDLRDPQDRAEFIAVLAASVTDDDLAGLQ